MWTKIRKLVPSSDRVSVTPIVGEDGKLANSEDEILEAWAAHREELGTPGENPLWNKEFTERIEQQAREIEAGQARRRRREEQGER